MAGALGAAIHGGYDLADVLHPYTVPRPMRRAQIDPRGMLTFGASGLGLWVIAWLILRGS